MSLDLLFCILSALCSAVVSWNIAFARGRAVGWLEHYDERVAKDRARRERNGQFKAREILQDHTKQ